MKLPYQARRRAALTANRPEPVDQVARINALTRNARTTWFALLAALVFVGVTLAGVEPIDFYGVNRATELPLVGVTVPTRLFFLAAPILTAAIYIYFHLYLIRLFDALGKAPARIGKEPLSEAIAPWLMNDAVLWVRRRNRHDGCHPEWRLDHLSAIFNIGLAWLFGLLILGWSWVAAWPARDYLMNAVGAVAFFVAFRFAIGSWISLRETAGQLADENVRPMRLALGAVTWVAAVSLAYFSVEKARIGSPWLATLDLTGEELIALPDGWLPYQIARRDFLAVWKAREGLEGELIPEDQARFDEEWSQRRALALADLERPSFDGTGERINFKDATLPQANLSGLNLQSAQMERANLLGAQIEGANLREAQMEGANLRLAQMEGADLAEAQMEGADLRLAQMVGVNFGYSHLTGRADRTNVLRDTNLSASTNNGGALRFVDLTRAQFDARTDFRNAFIDGSVKIPPALQDQLGDQCQSRLDEVLSDEEFYGRWRGWIEDDSNPNKPLWAQFGGAPPDYLNVTAIPPDPGCTWKTGPMPGAE